MSGCQPFLAPRHLAEALELLAASPTVQILAGGTDLWPQWTSGSKPKPAQVLSLHRLAELRMIQAQEGLLRLGACCTHRELATSPLVARLAPTVAEAAATIGALQIQNRGTLGGNLANGSPAADLPPPLVACSARVELSSVRGTRHLPLHAFYRGYRTLDLAADELVTAVLIPPLPPGAREHFRKVGTRRAQAISKVVGACRLGLLPDGTIGQAGLAFGSVAATVLRLTELETWLPGHPADAETAALAEQRTLELVHPIDDVRSSADYRRFLCGRLVHAFVLGTPPALSPS